VLAAAVLAAMGAVILGEYDLRGTTAIVGFPLFALAVTEVGVAVGGRLGRAVAAVPPLVGAALAWALWISFNHFRREQPPALSWVMVVVAVVVSGVWGRPGRQRSELLGGDELAVTGSDEEQQQT
jgi:hypothetical protein